MNICIIGAGYVGLVSAACFAEFGAQTMCVDRDEEKIKGLQAGRLPIYEPGLESLVARNAQQGRLSFSTSTPDAVRTSLVIFIAVQTPAGSTGVADLSAVEAVAREIGRSIDSYKVVVTKSTVPAGTSYRVREWIAEELAARGLSLRFHVASNPEFLREGAAIDDFMRPDRIVIGADDAEATAILKDLYRPLYLIETPIVETDVVTAELTKYAANLFLATKISFINEMANLCEALGTDVHDLARGIGLDRRIGTKFLHPGPGFGGSCFPKDARAAIAFARAAGAPLEMAEAVLRVNEGQAERMLKKIADALGGGVRDRCIALLGLSFKPETDDVREAPPLSIARALQSQGAQLRVFDPAAMDNATRIVPDLIRCADAYDACDGAHALVIATEWNQFRMLDLERVRGLLREPVIVDLRNVYEPGPVREAGFRYVCVGRT